MANEGDFFTEFFPSPPLLPGLENAHLYVDDKTAYFFQDPEVFEDIINVLRPGIIIEIGSWKGHSANAMADMTKKLGLNTKIVCVDHFLGGHEHWLLPEYRQELRMEFGRPNIFYNFVANTCTRNNSDVIYPLSLPSSVASIVIRTKGLVADLIYIDAGHDFNDVNADISNFWPALEQGGVMFGDDYPHGPVALAVGEFARQKELRILTKGRKWIYPPTQGFFEEFIKRGYGAAENSTNRG